MFPQSKHEKGDGNDKPRNEQTNKEKEKRNAHGRSAEEKKNGQGNMVGRNINIKMTYESKGLNLIRLKVHQRIRELCIMRLNIFAREKKFLATSE